MKKKLSKKRLRKSTKWTTQFAEFVKNLLKKVFTVLKKVWFIRNTTAQTATTVTQVTLSPQEKEEVDRLVAQVNNLFRPKEDALGKKIKNRQRANEQILQILYIEVSKQPEIRFSQLLRNLDIIREYRSNDASNSHWINEFNLESTDLLERIKKTVK